jgi:hypothetical protein
MEWTIGGLKPSHIISVEGPDANGRITLKCAVSREDVDDDPWVEVDAWNEIASKQITNTKLVNGGNIIQVAGGELLDVSDGENSWTGALHYVTRVIDKFSGELLEYTLKVEVEL